MARKGIRKMRVVHVNPHSSISAICRDEKVVETTKYGMLRLRFGELPPSSACEVAVLPECTGTADSNNVDQEV